MVYLTTPQAQTVKNLPAMGETWVQSLVWEDPLQKGKATYSSTPAFWPREFHGLYSHIESETTERLSLSMMIEDTVLVDPRVFFLTRSSNAATKVPAGHN